MAVWNEPRVWFVLENSNENRINKVGLRCAFKGETDYALFGSELLANESRVIDQLPRGSVCIGCVKNKVRLC